VPRKINIWEHEDGQDLAEYAVMLLLVVMLVIGTVRLMGGRASHVFSAVADVFQHQSDSD
jgi:Flp pilus assembly pilin Flp